MNWTIKKKIRLLLRSSLIGMIILCLFTGVAFLGQHYASKKSLEINNAVSTVKDIGVLMERARKYDESFMMSPSETGANLVFTTISKVKAKNNELKKEGLTKQAATIEKSLKSYEEGFKNLQIAKNQIGYDEDSGHRKSINSSISEITKFIDTTHNQALSLETAKMTIALLNYQRNPTKENYNKFLKEKDLLDHQVNNELSDKDSNVYDNAMLDLWISTESMHDADQLTIQMQKDFNKGTEKIQNAVNDATSALVTQQNQINKKLAVLQTILLITMVILAMAVILGIGWFGMRLIRSITESIQALKDGAKLLGSGRLSHRVHIQTKDEMAELAESFNNMAENMEETVQKVTEAAETLSSSSQNLAAVSEETSAQAFEVNEAIQQVAVGAQNQAEHLEESMTLLSRVSQAINESTAYSEDIYRQSQNAQEINQKGLKVVQVLEEGSAQFLQIAKQLITEIQAVASESEKITNILKIIQDISSNTDLLALNAAIESARAGEAGRGFAVVSHEIRKLAERSKKETANIQQVIGGIIKKLNEMVSAANMLNDYTNRQDENVTETKKAFGNIADNVTAISEKITSIKKAIENVSQANVDLSTKLEEISAISEETAASTEQVTASSENQTAAIESVNHAAMKLQEIAIVLEQEVSKFEIGSDEVAKDIDEEITPAVQPIDESEPEIDAEAEEETVLLEETKISESLSEEPQTTEKE
ncbi:methyl-accepting chemotaxis protein [Tuberibacillus calidus]|uniref:methyl-accepting chemotaxis protein n=1 Tax=Tuberibacillus calidus TaxID=340097 RepID=UPI000410D47C|nr:methyl-accepting chemotaxis protein [Tuberibacillus calidus]